MADRHGPLRPGRFTVEIDDVEISGWQSVNIPATSTEPDEDGWGSSTTQDLEAERGVQPNDTVVHDWNEAVLDDDEDEGLKTVVVTLQDEEGEPQIEWTFEEAWVTYYRPPQLDAVADGEVATERVVLAFDSMERQEV